MGYIGYWCYPELLLGDRKYLTRENRRYLKENNIRIVGKPLGRPKKETSYAKSKKKKLKNICQIEHTRHRSQEGFMVNLISGLIAYCYLPKRPSLNLEVVDQSLALCY